MASEETPIQTPRETAIDMSVFPSPTTMARYTRGSQEEEIVLSVAGSLDQPRSNADTSENFVISERRHQWGRNLWSYRSKIQKTLLIALGSSILLGVLIGTVVFFTQEKEEKYTSQIRIYDSPKEGSVCLTQKCLISAARILSYLDINTNPCEDFYQFACGNWEAQNPIPEGKVTWGNFGKVEWLNQGVIRKILDSPMTAFRSEAEKKAKYYYDSCIDDQGIIEKLGASPILELIKKIGGWHISGNFDIKKWSLQITLQLLHHEFNIGGLFSWTIGEDDRNTSIYTIQISQTATILPPGENFFNISFNEDLKEVYLRYMTKVGVLIGYNHLTCLESMKDVLDFETELAAIMPGVEDPESENQEYHLMTIAEVQELAPFIQWQQFFSSAFRRIRRFISSTDRVVVRTPRYLKKMSELVMSYTGTQQGKIIVHNYLVWHTIQTFIGSLPKGFRNAYRNVRRFLNGPEGTEELWLTCVINTNNVLGYATGAMFVRQVFQPDYKSTAHRMINEIKDAFIENLENYHWMDEETREAAIKKAKALKDVIGFPEFILDPAKLDELYKDLDIRENEYFMNNLRIKQFNFRNNLQNYNKVVSKSKWELIPSAVNAYYSPKRNQIVFPAGIMRPPFFDTGNPESLNYGAIGVVMGHELVHAFDNMGAEYDSDGNRKSWWKKETISRFKQKAECIIQQYSGYRHHGRYINGKQTLRENMADNGGVKAAFEAYMKKNRSEFELPLPGLNVTHRQLFFISFAQAWCSVSTEEEGFMQMIRDFHSPSKYRVNGALKNLRQFGEEFNCPENSLMNPRKKCEIW